jgi:hypothetical protein
MLHRSSSRTSHTEILFWGFPEYKTGAETCSEAVLITKTKKNRKLGF